MINKLVSVNVVIAKIVRDLDLGKKEINWQDFIEWIAEGLAHIGAYSQFTQKETVIPVVDHRAEVPCDFYELIQVTEVVGCSCTTGSQYDMIKSGLKALGLYNPNDPTILEPLSLKNIKFAQGVTLGNNRLHEQLRSNQDFINTCSMNLSIGSNDYRYVKEGGYFMTKFRDGFLRLSYLAIPVDCEGYPMIPENVSFFDALFWKVAYHLSMRGYEFPNPEMRNLSFCKRKWDFYCKQARGEAEGPGLEELNQLANIFNSLVPLMHQHEVDYRNVGRNNQPIWRR